MSTLRTLSKIFLAILLGIVTAYIPIYIIAKPQGGQVEHGDITISSDTGNAIDTLIIQQSQKGIINWQSFSIGKTEHTHFAQPGASAITLNRVLGGNLSSILGRLTATGRVFIINPAGILFGPSATVDVAGLIATTSNISSKDFLSGNYYFVQGAHEGAKIINQGYIEVAENGLVFLTAPSIENVGLIEAKLGGKIVLAATPEDSAYILDFYGDQLLQFVVPSDIESHIDTAITQSGQIIAPGGTVLLTAETAKSVVDKAINMTGIIEATTISNQGGQIILSGGKRGIVSVSGKISAKGKKAGERGGKVKITGEKVGLLSGSSIDVSGMAGGGKVLIGADYLGGNIISAAKATYVSPEAIILADATVSGDGGDIIVWSDEATRFYGTASAKGGPLGGKGGFVETSSKKWLDVYGAKIDVSAPAGEPGLWLLDPHNITIGIGTTTSMTSGPNFTSTNDSAVLNISDLISALATGDVIVQTGIAGEPPILESGDITLATTLNTSSTNQLTLIALNDIIINAEIAAANLDLILDAQNLINIGTSLPINVNSIHFQAPLVLKADTTLTVGSGGTTFDSTIKSFTSGSHGLDITSIGNIEFKGEIGGGSLPLEYLTVTGPGTLYIKTAPKITTTSYQTYDAPVVLETNTELLTTLASGNIRFEDTIGGAYKLTINAQGDVIFEDVISGLGSLEVDTAPSKKIEIHTDTISTFGAQEYKKDVELFGDTKKIFSTSLSHTIGFPIKFIAGLFGDTTGTNPDVDMFSKKYIELHDVQRIKKLLLVGSGDKKLAGNISNVEEIDIFTLGTIMLGDTTPISISTSKNQIYRDPTNISSGINVTLSTDASGTIQFLDTVEGPGGLIINTDGTVEFDDTVGATNALSSLIISNANEIDLETSKIRTSGPQTYGGPVDIGSGVTSELITTPGSGGNILFSDIIEGTGGLKIDADGAITFTGTVGATDALSSFEIVKGTPSLPTSIITSGDQTYGVPVTIASGITTLESGNDILFSDAVGGPGGLDIDTTGNLSFLSTVGGPSPTYLPLSSLTVDTGTPFLLPTNITTTGDQKYFSTIIIPISNSLLKTTGLGKIEFENTISLFGILDIDSTGNVVFNDIVSGTTPLGILDITATGADIIINTPQITTINYQLYNTPVILKENTVTLTALGNITFGSTIDSFVSGSPRILIIDSSGTTTFGGAIGATRPLASIIITSPGTTLISGGAMKTAGAQTYNQPVELGADTTFEGSSINFLSTIDSETSTARSLTIDASSDTTFGDRVGSVNALNEILLLNSTSTTYFAAASPLYTIKTTGKQEYSGPIVLKNNTSLLGGNEIVFGSTIDSFNVASPKSLIINVQGGETKFYADVGNVNPTGDASIQNLEVFGTSGQTQFHLPQQQIRTMGYQKYGDEVSLRANNIKLTAEGNIEFLSTPSSIEERPFNLILDSNGNILFESDVGKYGTPIGILQILNAHNVTSNAGIYVTAFFQQAGSGTTRFNNPAGTGRYTNLLYVGPPYTVGGIPPLVDGTGIAEIFANRIEGRVNLGKLFIGNTVSSIDLTGYVGGISGIAAFQYIIIDKPKGEIGYGDFRFDATDYLDYEGIFGFYDQDLIDDILKTITENYNFGFGYEFLNLYDSEFDYMLLIDPLECELIES